MYRNQHDERLGPGIDLPSVAARIYALSCDFLLPYLEPFGHFVRHPEEADFILCMNSTKSAAIQNLFEARRWNKPLAWWTIEDPNWYDSFLPQAGQADFIFTTDEACLPQYYKHLDHQRVFWLPLACSPLYHHPLELAEESRDFVLSANWYLNQARLRGVETAVEPLRQAGYTLTLFCYESFMWPPPYRSFWCGERHYRTIADQYRYGRVVLGINNQRSGMDGRVKTYMTSMRTFEALACRKPLLAAYSDAYERLGFINGEHMAWVDTQADTLLWAKRLLGADGELIAQAGRQFVLSHHTYAHRLAHIAEVVLG